MTDRPISLAIGDVRALRDGTRTELRRPIGMCSRDWRVGDRLWVREPFRLLARYDAYRPTAIIDGVSPSRILWEADLEGIAPLIWGQRRYARVLPLAAHRQHLVIEGIRRERLHDITQAQAQAQGWPDRHAFLRDWGVSQFTNSTARQNPTVVVATVQLITAPLRRVRIEAAAA